MMTQDKFVPDKKLYSALEVARLAKTSVVTIRKLCTDKTIKAERVGNAWVITSNEVVKFLSSWWETH